MTANEQDEQNKKRLDTINTLAHEYDMRPSRVQADASHKYGALFIGNVGGEWEVHGFNDQSELNESLTAMFGDKLEMDTVDRIVDLDTATDVEFRMGVVVQMKETK